MTILKIIHGFPPLYNAGSEVYSHHLVNQLAKQHTVHVFTREENIYKPDFSIHSYSISDNLHIHLVNMARGKDGFRHEKLDAIFENWMQSIKPDVAHIGHLNHLSTGLVDVLHQHQIPIIFTLHDFWLMCPRGQFLQVNFAHENMHTLCNQQTDHACATHCYNRYFTGIESNAIQDFEYWKNWIRTRMQETRKVASVVNKFIAPSEYLRNRFIQEFDIPAEKIEYLDYGFPQFKKTKSRINTEVFTFGYIGTHIPAKGINLLIEAFSRIQMKARLVIWGAHNAYTPYLMEMANNCTNEVLFPGSYLNNEIDSKVLGNIDCIVVPSIWVENSPLVIHEAQACQIPVITANAGGMAEYVKHEVNGLLFEHRNASSLAEMMQLAIEHPHWMQELGKRAYLYTENHEVIDIEQHTNKIIELYTHIMKYATKSVANNA